MRLRRDESKLSTDSLQRLPDEQRFGINIRVAPAQAEDFAASQSSGKRKDKDTL